MKYKIGIIEDDVMIADLLKNQLQKYGFDIWVCQDFSAIDAQVNACAPHLLLLDINLPYYDGFFWCKKIRQFSTIPILFVSARNMDLDQIYAIECGGDDYVTKPFSYEIVTAKINAHLRRNYGEYAIPDNTKVALHGTTIDIDSLKMQYQDKTVNLTKNEKDILSCLFQAYPNPVKRSELLQVLWDTESFVEENTLNVNIGRARKRMQEIGCPFVIKAIRNVGYVMEIVSDE